MRSAGGAIERHDIVSIVKTAPGQLQLQDHKRRSLPATSPTAISVLQFFSVTRLFPLRTSQARGPCWLALAISATSTTWMVGPTGGFPAFNKALCIQSLLPSLRQSIIHSAPVAEALTKHCTLSPCCRGFDEALFTQSLLPRLWRSIVHSVPVAEALAKQCSLSPCCRGFGEALFTQSLLPRL